jgi:hypothetical protein
MHFAIQATIAGFMLLAGYTNATLAQEATRQIKLTEKQVEAFIAAQKDMAAVVARIQGTASEGPNPKFQAELEAVTRRHGFKDFAEYENVAANISMVMAALDPQTKEFTDPLTAIKKEIEEVTSDAGLPDSEKKQLLEQLHEALKAAQPIQFPSNVELVRKYYDRIDAALG